MTAMHVVSIRVYGFRISAAAGRCTNGPNPGICSDYGRSVPTSHRITQLDFAWSARSAATGHGSRPNGCQKCARNLMGTIRRPKQTTTTAMVLGAWSRQTASCQCESSITHVHMSRRWMGPMHQNWTGLNR